MQSDGRCHVCNRTEATIDRAGLCQGGIGCEANRVDWRVRALEAEDQLVDKCKQHLAEAADADRATEGWAAAVRDLSESNRERDEAMREHCSDLQKLHRMSGLDPSMRWVANIAYPTHAARLYPERKNDGT